MSDGAGDSDIERAARRAAERRLVEAAVAGSTAAFEQLYRLHVRKVHGLCLRMTGQRELAEDCTQEAFIQAWRALPRFEARAGFGTWLHRIAVNAVLGQARRRGERLGTDASVDDQVAETLADAGVERGHVVRHDHAADLRAGVVAEGEDAPRDHPASPRVLGEEARRVRHVRAVSLHPESQRDRDLPGAGRAG